MARNRRTFRRALGQRRYRRIFVIATEGTKTEPSYFAIFNNDSVIHVHCVKGNDQSSPTRVLWRLQQALKRHEVTSMDEAWLVVDKDGWTDEQLGRLHEWAQEETNRGLALSNPKFEYWLLLHFEEGTNIGTPSELSRRLRKHLPRYDKGIEARHLTNDMVLQAVCRAKRRDSPPCSDWPRAQWRTTVYRLVDNIVQAQGES